MAFLPGINTNLNASSSAFSPHFGNVDGPHELHVGEGLDVLNQPLQHQEPARAADVLLKDFREGRIGGFTFEAPVDFERQEDGEC